MGKWRGATWVPKAWTSASRVRSKEARSRSILFTRMARGSPASTAISQTTSCCTCTPSTAETTKRQESAARRAACTSPMKSAYPGASRTLIFVPLHSTGASASETLICFLVSSGSKSVTVFPSSTVPILVTAPVAKRRASASTVFPVPPWPTSRTLRIALGSYVFMGSSRLTSPGL